MSPGGVAGAALATLKGLPSSPKVPKAATERGAVCSVPSHGQETQHAPWFPRLWPVFWVFSDYFLTASTLA